MNKIHRWISLIVFFYFILQSVNFAQNNTSYYSNERINLLTDRTLYISGEKIRFSATLFSDDKKAAFSKILYVEIITPENKKEIGAKYLIQNNFCAGTIEIPKDLISGIYYLKAYTKYMRNFSPNEYEFTEIKIVNPKSVAVLDNEKNIPDAKIKISENIDDKSKIQIFADKSEYQTGENINLKIIENFEAGDSLKNICVTVVPESSINQHCTFTNPEKHKVYKLTYFPETRDVSITGCLTEKKTGKSVSNKTVKLSLPADKDFMAAGTDSSGRFYFSVPLIYGRNDVFLCSDNSENSEENILIDNDFCSNPVNLPSPAFTLSEDERKTAFDFAVNTQIFSKFKTEIKHDSTQNQNPPFYGKPSQTVYFDKFVDLPTLEEYFNELPFKVKVRKQHGKKYFKNLSNQAEMNIYNPLVLLDWLAVENPDKLLAVSPQKISRIELINEPYIKGDNMYGGIISIISKRGDFAGIDLPKSGTFLNYTFLSDGSENEITTSQNSDLPDTRNTLFWKPQIVLNSQNKAEFSFPASPSKGKYTVLVRGINGKGEIVSNYLTFEVK